MSTPIAQFPLLSGATAFVLRLVLATTVTWLLAGAVNLIHRRSSASLRHRVWSMSMAAALTLPVLMALAPQWQVAHVAGALTPAVEPVRKVEAGAQPPIANHSTASNVGDTTGESHSPLSGRIGRTGDAAISPVAMRRATLPPAPLNTTALGRHASSARFAWLSCLAGAWSVVATWLLARLAVSLLVARKIVRRSQPIEKGVALRELRRVAMRLTVALEPPLRQSNEIRTPICVGCVWPCIVLPADHGNWDAEQLGATLTHELAHVARRDVLWQMIARLTCSVYWFHPLSWIAAWRMRVERELACDDYVLRGGAPSTRYARWLVKIADSIAVCALAAEQAGVAMASPHGFETRLAAILDPCRKRAPLSRRATRWIAAAAAFILLTLAVVNPMAPTATAGPTSGPAKSDSTSSTQPTEIANPRQRMLRLTCIDATSGKPITGVKGNYWPDQQNASNNNIIFTTDPHGQAILSFPATAKSVSFFFYKENYVESLMVLGGEFGVAPLSDAFTLKLQRGLQIGGVIQDPQGNGVGSAELQLTFQVPAAERHGGNGMAYGTATSDAHGRWTFGGAPAHPTSISVYVRHADFVPSSFGHEYSASEYAGFLAKSQVTVIQRGIIVSGNVVDQLGKPVAGAELSADGASQTTDAVGHFELHGVEPGPRSLTARAGGYALQLADVVVAKDMKPVIFKLEAGHVLHGRVVDPRGTGIPNAMVIVDRWRELTGMRIMLPADDSGRFTWNEAPADPVTLSVQSKRGFITLDSVTAIAGEKDIVITMTPVTVLHGSAVDDRTGKPIDRFSVQVSGKERVGGWRMDRSGLNGAYEATIAWAAVTLQVRITAAGYLPIESPDLKPNGNDLRFDARLKTTGGMTGTVMAPDGTPAAGADVVLIQDLGVAAENGVLAENVKTANLSTVTDTSGRFTLPQRTGKLNFALFHASGWNLITKRADESLQNLPLHAWCTVQGVLMKGNKPWPDQPIVLTPTSQAGDTFYERQAFRYGVKTDAQGRFELKRVIDGTSSIGVSAGEFGELSQCFALDLRPGETITGLQLGGTGRPVVAKIEESDELKAKNFIPMAARLNRVPPPAFVHPANWAVLPNEVKTRLLQQYEQSAEYRMYAAHPSSIIGPIKPDGSVRFEDVPAGEYMLMTMVERPTPDQPNNWRPVAEAQKRMSVADMPGGRSDDPFDGGTLVLEPVTRLTAGEMAPNFEPADFNKGRAKLSDFRGKYVLLDFWATWCGPCIAEFKHMSALHQAYADDPRFVMIGVSTDDGPDDPAKFLRDHHLPWTQVYGGPSARTHFGFDAIPSVWLIGPDGKIIARDIPAGNLDRVVKKALERV